MGWGRQAKRETDYQNVLSVLGRAGRDPGVDDDADDDTAGVVGTAEAADPPASGAASERVEGRGRAVLKKWGVAEERWRRQKAALEERQRAVDQARATAAEHCARALAGVGAVCSMYP